LLVLGVALVFLVTLFGLELLPIGVTLGLAVAVFLVERRIAASGVVTFLAGEVAFLVGDAALFAGDAALLAGDAAFFGGDAAFFAGEVDFFAGDAAFFAEDAACFAGEVIVFAGEVGFFVFAGEALRGEALVEETGSGVGIFPAFLAAAAFAGDCFFVAAIVVAIEKMDKYNRKCSLKLRKVSFRECGMVRKQRKCHNLPMECGLLTSTTSCLESLRLR
jgi:hypothetical protein